MTQHDNRDASTGQYVTDEYAGQHPETTIRETRKPGLTPAAETALITERSRLRNVLSNAREDDRRRRDGGRAVTEPMDTPVVGGPIETAEQLDALPVGSVVLIGGDLTIEKRGSFWQAVGQVLPLEASTVAKYAHTARLLFRPDAPAPAPSGEGALRDGVEHLVECLEADVARNSHVRILGREVVSTLRHFLDDPAVEVVSDALHHARCDHKTGGSAECDSRAMTAVDALRREPAPSAPGPLRRKEDQ